MDYDDFVSVKTEESLLDEESFPSEEVGPESEDLVTSDDENR